MPDVLNAHCATPAGWAALEVAGKVEPRPRVVLTEHTGPFDLLLADPEIAERTLAACRDADAICAVGDFLAEEMKRAGVDREIAIIGNPAAADFAYAPAPPPRRTSDGQPSYSGIYTGRFTRKKGMLELADAIDQLAGDPSFEIRWEFFGFFEDEADVIDRLRGLAASGRITIHGIQGRAEIAQAMRECHFLVLPTYRDNCPLSVVEALSMGRPVVGTRGTGLDTYVLEGDGILCEPRNPADLARAIREAMGTTWDARTISDRAESRFGWNAIAQKYAPLFRGSA
jgi:glycosyltransferase involved in cell wall biosynthesis